MSIYNIYDIYECISSPDTTLTTSTSLLMSPDKDPTYPDIYS